MSKLPHNQHIGRYSDLVTTHEARRQGFLDFALRRNTESIPFIDEAKALRAILLDQSTKCHDILDILEIKDSLLKAAGISVKAASHLSNEDKQVFLQEFIDTALESSGSNYIDEIIYRYLLTNGDALGGKMRNIVGKIAAGKFNRFIISQLVVRNIPFDYTCTDGSFNPGTTYTSDKAEDIKSFRWKNGSKSRSLIFNVKVPNVGKNGKNVDIVFLNQFITKTKGAGLTAVLSQKKNYLALGELKGGIDPAGADEHWKTANTSLSRIRSVFGKRSLFFIGAAIEAAMAREIMTQARRGDLSNCANLTNDDQLSTICTWLCNL
jgi:type II restriction enzyme